MEILKFFTDEIMRRLTMLFNDIMEKEYVPTQWDTSERIVLH